MPESIRPNRWLSFGEIFLIFALFALQGSWPVPDVNEAHYLGKAAHFWDANWIRGDFFLDSADSHKVFYFAFGWLTLLLPLTAVAWTGRILTWLLMAWAWRRLSNAIFFPSGATACLPRGVRPENSVAWNTSDSKDRISLATLLLGKPVVRGPEKPEPVFGWSILSAALFVMLNERFQMAGEWFIGGVEAKGFAYVLMLLGLESLVRDRWNRAWLLFGAAAGFHALVGGWAVVAAGITWLFLGKRSSPHPNPLPKGEGTSRPRFLSMLPGLFGGFLLSLPGVLPALAMNWNIDAETIRQANVIYVFERLRHHLDIFQFKMGFLLRFALLTLFFLVLYRWVKKIAGKEPPSETMPLLRLQTFTVSSLIIALFGISIGLISLYDRPLTAGLLRFYWFRLADIALPLGTAFSAFFWIREKYRAKSFWGSVGSALAMLLALYHFNGYISERIKPGPARGDKNMIAASLAANVDQPARSENLAEWQDACRWIAENTPADARFFTPRLSQTFKWYARRAEVVTWKDVPQDAGALVAWWNRIRDVFATGGTLPEFRWRENAVEMEPESLMKLAKKYEAEYLIAPVSQPPAGWKEIYHNQGYVVYRIQNP